MGLALVRRVSYGSGGDPNAKMPLLYTPGVPLKFLFTSSCLDSRKLSDSSYCIARTYKKLQKTYENCPIL